MISQIRTAIAQFIRDEEGAAAIEYALIAGLISLGIITAATALGNDIEALFGKISTALKAVVV